MNDPGHRRDLADFHRVHRVRWRETGPLGIVPMHGVIQIMEETEYEFLRSHGLSVVASDSRGVIGFPRIATSIQVASAARFDEELDVWLFVQVFDGVKIEYRFEIESQSRPVATGCFTAVCCRFRPDEPPTAILVPDFFRQQFPTR